MTYLLTYLYETVQT